MAIKKSDLYSSLWASCNELRGGMDAIREQLVRSGILKGIIGLPANLFYGTGIPACILVLDKENATARPRGRTP